MIPSTTKVHILPKEYLSNMIKTMTFVSAAGYWKRRNLVTWKPIFRHLNRDMRFPNMWFVRPAMAQTSLHIRAVWSEPLQVAWVFYECSMSYSPNNIWSLKWGCTGSSVLHLSKCHIVGNHVSRLIYTPCVVSHTNTFYKHVLAPTLFQA